VVFYECVDSDCPHSPHSPPFPHSPFPFPIPLQNRDGQDVPAILLGKVFPSVRMLTHGGSVWAQEGSGSGGIVRIDTR
jgi:hypothetical protein